MSVTFYYSPQSNADRIHGSLKALGIPYEEVRVDLRAGDQKKPEFLALNPNGKVPTVVIDGTPMFESVAIQIALGERYGVEKGLWPALNSPEHLTAITWLVWSQVNLGAAVFRYIQNTSDWFPKEQHNPQTAAAALTDIKALMRILDDRLEGREYLTGSRFTLADLDIASVLGWGLFMVKLDMTAYPQAAAWLTRCSKYTGEQSAS
jgi:glutathione S-transferase